MTQPQAAADGRLVRRYDYGQRTVLAADVGTEADAVHADTLGSRALVVVERADGDEEFELELPGPDATIETNNGIITFEVDA